MPEEKDPPRPHGDKLKGTAGQGRHTPDDHELQPPSDEPPDAPGVHDAGAQRRRHYKEGADLVSGID
jgi:hypothetical protein